MKAKRSTVNWYFRDGTPATKPGMVLGSKRWTAAMRRVELKLRDYKYKVVRVTPLWWGGRVSTVWVGLDQSFDSDPKHTPIIFETMVFPFRGWGDMDMDRYATEEQAIAGHWKLYREWSNPINLIKQLYWGLSWKLKIWKARRSK